MRLLSRLNAALAVFITPEQPLTPPGEPIPAFTLNRLPSPAQYTGGVLFLVARTEVAADLRTTGQSLPDELPPEIMARVLADRSIIASTAPRSRFDILHLAYVVLIEQAIVLADYELPPFPPERCEFCAYTGDRECNHFNSLKRGVIYALVPERF
jgi:hypothetical protein